MDIEKRHKYKKGTDTNVGSIEEDIKRCEKLTELQNTNWIGISNQLAIAHLVEKIKELEKKNKYLKYLYDDCCKCLLDTIERQKVKDKIEELKEENQNLKNENKLYEFEIKSIKNQNEAAIKGLKETIVMMATASYNAQESFFQTLKNIDKKLNLIIDWGNEDNG